MGLVRAARAARQRGPIAVALGVVLGLAVLGGLVALPALPAPASPRLAVRCTQWRR
jgi:hypothetical protein